MRLLARVFMIIALISAIVLIGLGIASIFVLITYTSYDQIGDVIDQVIENYGLLNDNSIFTVIFSIRDKQTLVSLLAGLLIGMGMMSIPCTISCANALKRPTRGRCIACIVTGVISYNPIAIIAAILNLIAFRHDY